LTQAESLGENKEIKGLAIVDDFGVATLLIFKII